MASLLPEGYHIAFRAPSTGSEDYNGLDLDGILDDAWDEDVAFWTGDYDSIAGYGDNYDMSEDSYGDNYMLNGSWTDNPACAENYGNEYGVSVLMAITQQAPRQTHLQGMELDADPYIIDVLDNEYDQYVSAAMQLISESSDFAFNVPTDMLSDFLEYLVDKDYIARNNIPDDYLM